MTITNAIKYSNVVAELLNPYLKNKEFFGQNSLALKSVVEAISRKSNETSVEISSFGLSAFQFSHCDNIQDWVQIRTTVPTEKVDGKEVPRAKGLSMAAAQSANHILKNLKIDESVKQQKLPKEQIVLRHLFREAVLEAKNQGKALELINRVNEQKAAFVSSNTEKVRSTFEDAINKTRNVTSNILKDPLFRLVGGITAAILAVKSYNFIKATVLPQAVEIGHRHLPQKVMKVATYVWSHKWSVSFYTGLASYISSSILIKCTPINWRANALAHKVRNKTFAIIFFPLQFAWTMFFLPVKIWFRTVGASWTYSNKLGEVLKGEPDGTRKLRQFKQAENAWIRAVTANS